MEEAAGGDNDLFSDLPVHVISDGEGGSEGSDGGCDASPGFDSRLTIHGELAVEAANALVAEHGLLSIVVSA